MSPVRIWICDAWHPTSRLHIERDNELYRLLCTRFDVVLDPRDPEFLIYSPFGVEHRRYDCVRIFVTGENQRPNYAECDYAFSFDYPVTDRNWRLPFYTLVCYHTRTPLEPLLEPRQELGPPAAERRFCAFIYSNPRCKERNRFFELLSRYRRVDAPGRVCNNMRAPELAGRSAADWHLSKRRFLRNYKFTIAFENESYPGYTTEKIIDPMLAGSLPIYWGNPRVDRDFSTASFINVHDFPSVEAAAEHVAAVDRDPALYDRYMTSSCFPENGLTAFVDLDRVLDRFAEIFSRRGLVPVARSPFNRALRRMPAWAAAGLRRVRPRRGDPSLATASSAGTGG
ncbi:MAG: glycosyltransferase [Myxococcales bacterium]|nr:glycosyltransferase [Myxococcales bacterium]